VNNRVTVLTTSADLAVAQPSSILVGTTAMSIVTSIEEIDSESEYESIAGRVSNVWTVHACRGRISACKGVW